MKKQVLVYFGILLQMGLNPHLSALNLGAKNINDINQELATTKLYGVQGAQYDGASWSGIAGLETREYRWPTFNWSWKKYNLEWPSSAAPKHRYYSGKVPTYFKKGSDDKLFVVFGTSFTGFKRGTWTRKYTDQIKRMYPTASVIFFPGYLSEENLKEAKPTYPDPSVRFVARDYLIRLVSLLSKLQQEGISYKKIGLLGSSGGASIVLRVLEDDKFFRKTLSSWPKNLFNWGSLSLSPAVDAVAACETVDQQADYLENSGQVTLSYTVEDWIIEKILFGWLPRVPRAKVQSLLELTKEPKRGTYQNFRNLVVYSVIQSLKDFSKAQSPDYRGNLRLTPYYRDYAFNKIREIHGKDFNYSYSRFTSFESAAENIDKAATLVFGLDDPLLSSKVLFNPEAAPHSNVQKVLNSFRSNKNVRLEVRRYGGHLGYVFNTEYLDSLFLSTFKQ